MLALGSPSPDQSLLGHMELLPRGPCLAATSFSTLTSELPLPPIQGSFGFLWLLGKMPFGGFRDQAVKEAQPISLGRMGSDLTPPLFCRHHRSWQEVKPELGLSSARLKLSPILPLGPSCAVLCSIRWHQGTGLSWEWILHIDAEFVLNKIICWIELGSAILLELCIDLHDHIQQMKQLL